MQTVFFQFALYCLDNNGVQHFLHFSHKHKFDLFDPGHVFVVYRIWLDSDYCDYFKYNNIYI